MPTIISDFYDSIEGRMLTIECEECNAPLECFSHTNVCVCGARYSCDGNRMGPASLHPSESESITPRDFEDII